jgi:hypothetical protein
MGETSFDIPKCLTLIAVEQLLAVDCEDSTVVVLNFVLSRSCTLFLQLLPEVLFFLIVV